jgi:hypothetical protein
MERYETKSQEKITRGITGENASVKNLIIKRRRGWA